jgi:hypothetical protein
MLILTHEAALTDGGKGLLSGNVLTVHNRGGTLTVTVSGIDGKVDSLLLEGPTEVTKIYEV